MVLVVQRMLAGQCHRGSHSFHRLARGGPGPQASSPRAQEETGKQMPSVRPLRTLQARGGGKTQTLTRLQDDN